MRYRLIFAKYSADWKGLMPTICAPVCGQALYETPSPLIRKQLFTLIIF